MIANDGILCCGEMERNGYNVDRKYGITERTMKEMVAVEANESTKDGRKTEKRKKKDSIATVWYGVIGVWCCSRSFVYLQFLSVLFRPFDFFLDDFWSNKNTFSGFLDGPLWRCGVVAL